MPSNPAAMKAIQTINICESSFQISIGKTPNADINKKNNTPLNEVRIWRRNTHRTCSPLRCPSKSITILYHIAPFFLFVTTNDVATNKKKGTTCSHSGTPMARKNAQMGNFDSRLESSRWVISSSEAQIAGVAIHSYNLLRWVFSSYLALLPIERW